MRTPTDTRPAGTYPLAGHEISRIGYGAMQLTPHGAPPIADELGIGLLRQATELGIDHIDTAQFYGSGRANALIRSALHPYPSDLALATKVGARSNGDGALVAAQRPEELRAEIEANLRELGAERIAVVNLRRLDARPGILAEGDQRVDLDAQLAELAALRDEGLIEAIGLSNVSAAQIERALPVGLTCVQNSYSLVDRSAEEALQRCLEHGIAWVPFFPLGSAFPGRPKVTDDATVQRIAGELGATAGQIGLAWLLQRAPNVMVIPGTRDPAHLAENVAAGEVRLSDEMIAALDRVTDV